MELISRAEWDALAGEGTDAHRLGWTDRGWLDRYGDWLLWSDPAGGLPPRCREDVRARFGFEPRGWLVRRLARTAREQAAPALVDGEAPGRIEVREGGRRYWVEPAAGYSSGLFLDQRINRAWVAGLAPRASLNLFAYTCSFSVCAARGGGTTRSVDVSKRALAWGRENLILNGLDPDHGHACFADDAAAHVARLERRGERFDLVVLDPPTFGRAGARTFQLERDLPGLADACIALLQPGGWLLLSCNRAGWTTRDLQRVLESAARGRALECERGPEPLPHGAVSCRARRR
jgi:23S rRNA (cytosine1962-C5)-methyltransferase